MSTNITLPNCFGKSTSFTEDDLHFMKRIIDLTWGQMAPDMLADEDDTYTAAEVVSFALEKYPFFTEGDDTVRMDELCQKYNEVLYEHLYQLIPLITHNQTYGY